MPCYARDCAAEIHPNRQVSATKHQDPSKAMCTPCKRSASVPPSTRSHLLAGSLRLPKTLKMDTPGRVRRIRSMSPMPRGSPVSPFSVNSHIWPEPQLPVSSSRSSFSFSSFCPLDSVVHGPVCHPVPRAVPTLTPTPFGEHYPQPSTCNWSNVPRLTPAPAPATQPQLCQRLSFSMFTLPFVPLVHGR